MSGTTLGATDRTLSAGEQHLDLGVYARLVHNHKLETPITIRFEIDLPSVDMPLDFLSHLAPFNTILPDLELLSRFVQRAAVAVTILGRITAHHVLVDNHPDPPHLYLAMPSLGHRSLLGWR